METRKFMPNSAGIEERKLIKPFGKGLMYSSPINKEQAEFIQCVDGEISDVATHKTPKASVPRPAPSSKAILGSNKVKITNLPLHIRLEDLKDIIRKNAPPSSFINVFIPKVKKELPDGRIEEISRGHAYVECTNQKKARELAKKMNGMVVESFKLNFEYIN